MCGQRNRQTSREEVTEKRVEWKMYMESKGRFCFSDVQALYFKWSWRWYDHRYHAYSKPSLHWCPPPHPHHRIAIIAIIVFQTHSFHQVAERWAAAVSSAHTKPVWSVTTLSSSRLLTMWLFCLFLCMSVSANLLLSWMGMCVWT